jgi:uncharacterized protein (TIGR00159 family)
MVPVFITLGLFDILDILLVAFLFYQVYLLIKGSVAINIFAGLFSFYLLWLLVRALNMELLSSILGQFIGVGVIALLIVFQQEIRKFLLMVGTRYNFNQRFSLENLFSPGDKTMIDEKIDSIVEACERMGRTKTGALIVIAKQSQLNNYAGTGEILKARISSSILESIFFKNSPLHDGAVIISDNRILAARCILPISDNTNIPVSLGLRHRAAIGMTQETDAHVVIVSEETGYLSYVMGGNIKVHIDAEELRKFLLGDYSSFIVS